MDRSLTEYLGFLGMFVGLITAVLNRKRIVVLRLETCSSQETSPVQSQCRSTIGKRCKRLLLAFVFGMICLTICGSAQQSGNDGFATFMVFPFLICFFIGAYQFAAILLMMLWGIMRVFT